MTAKNNFWQQEKRFFDGKKKMSRQNNNREIKWKKRYKKRIHTKWSNIFNKRKFRRRPATIGFRIAVNNERIWQRIKTGFSYSRYTLIVRVGTSWSPFFCNYNMSYCAQTLTKASRCGLIFVKAGPLF